MRVEPTPAGCDHVRPLLEARDTILALTGQEQPVTLCCYVCDKPVKLAGPGETADCAVLCEECAEEGY